MLTEGDTRPKWTYQNGEELPEVVVLFDDSEDSNRLLDMLRRCDIPTTLVPKNGRDPEEWPDSSLPAIYLPSESKGGRLVIFRGLRKIQTQFLARFDFSALSGRDSLT
jgi:hypothetical protein